MNFERFITYKRLPTQPILHLKTLIQNKKSNITFRYSKCYYFFWKFSVVIKLDNSITKWFACCFWFLVFFFFWVVDEQKDFIIFEHEVRRRIE
jgi:hypothetical protein